MSSEWVFVKSHELATDQTDPENGWLGEKPLSFLAQSESLSFSNTLFDIPYLSPMSRIYFASDFHLGLDLAQSSKDRERMIVGWLEEIASDAREIFLVGDLFDFWFEYRSVIPRGFTRFIGMLARLKDQGVAVHIFTGNHDMWMFNYFEKELGIPIYRNPIIREFDGKKFYIGHGDGLGPGDHGYKMLKRIFSSKICQWLFARLHPNLAFGLAKFWSARSRAKANKTDAFRGKDHEWLVSYANELSATLDVDYFVFGHRHLPIRCLLDNGFSQYINLGDWMTHRSYAVFDGKSLTLEFYKNSDGAVIQL